jgi:thiamine biosynthesis lipoprotein
MYAKVLSNPAIQGEPAAVPVNPEPDVAESQEAMGTVFEILAYGEDKRNLAAAARQALREVSNLDEQISRWKSASDISWINRHAAVEPVRVEPELFEFLLRCREFWRETKGAFDITVAPVVRVWGFYGKKGKLPTPEELKSAREISGMQHVLFDEDGSTISFDRVGIEIDLGGIGKGYAVDRAVEMLRTCKVEAALVNSGDSTMYAIGRPPKQEAWQIGVRDPADETKSMVTLALRDGSVSTSGAPEKVFEIEGKEYSHILDARTGLPAEGMVSASAIAPTATETDALGTAFYVLGPAGTRAYCRDHKDVRAILIPESGPGERPGIVTIAFDGK